MQVGVGAEMRFEVGEADTARALGSGDLDVLGTPRLIAWLEAATCAAVRDQLERGQTTVGTGIDVEHWAPSAVGATVAVSARLVEVEGRSLRFEVAARDGTSDDVLAEGTITRAMLDTERFLARLRG